MCSEKDQEVLLGLSWSLGRTVPSVSRRPRSGLALAAGPEPRLEVVGDLVGLSALSGKQLGPRRAVGSS